MRIRFKILEAQGFKVEFSSKKQELSIFSEEGWEPETRKMYEEFCDRVQLTLRQRDEIGDTIWTMQVMTAIENASK